MFRSIIRKDWMGVSVHMIVTFNSPSDTVCHKFKFIFYTSWQVAIQSHLLFWETT